MRYEERKPVVIVLKWLEQQSCPIAFRSYKDFMGRVLRLMSLARAEALGVDVDLLRAVRVRLKLPLDPRRVRSTLGKPLTRFDSRHRSRRLQILPKAKRPVLVARSVGKRDRIGDPRPLSPSGFAPVPETPSERLTGDPSNLKSLTLADWRIINKAARLKLLQRERKIESNWEGRVFHRTTHQQYTRQELMAQFGLSVAEAESCYLTL